MSVYSFLSDFGAALLAHADLLALGDLVRDAGGLAALGADQHDLGGVDRPEGRYGDGVGVIPIDVGNKIRLYCLRLSDKVLIFGNGGVKDADSWQNSKVLAPYVRLLVETSRFVTSRMRDGQIILMDKELMGNLNFVINEKE